MFGSAQLIQQKVEVKAIFNEETVKELSQDYMYMRMLRNIYEVKSFGLVTNSPFISEIHMKPEMTWEKINNGMVRHFSNEILGKWPVIQHFWFGNLLGFK